MVSQVPSLLPGLGGSKFTTTGPNLKFQRAPALGGTRPPGVPGVRGPASCEGGAVMRWTLFFFSPRGGQAQFQLLFPWAGVLGGGLD